uniref:discoidin domain-containing protein n=1 Tax=uncultured Dysgonomonas sp. TaxID=206096 RepID=UPI00260DD8DA|nr:discoidin domain-containing protein [uncultured Dysgonomonas sp.]
MKHLTLIFLLLFLLNSCQSNLSKDVTYALELAGENRSELEKVLYHYKQTNKKKYEAACFLISNMQYHRSKHTITLDSAYYSFFYRTDFLYNEIFQHYKTSDILSFKSIEYDDLRKGKENEFSNIPLPEVEENTQTDLQLVKSGFLIDNIERAFEVWENSPLLKDMPFDDFKEFILPYRTTNEELLLTRSDLQKMWVNRLGIDGFSNITLPLERYKAYVEKCRWLNYYTRPEKHIALFDLFLPKFKMDCHNMTNWSCNILRACGIPAVYEYTPQWKERSSRHFWCTSPDSTGILQPYTAPDNNVREDWQSDIKYAGKVYRKTFAANKRSPFFLAEGSEYIPDELSSPLLLDQTFRYHQTITLRLPFNENTKNNLAYLCMFKEGELNPVGWGIINQKTKEVIFEQVPLNTVFIPVYYDDQTIVNLGEPFMVYSSGITAGISMPLTSNHQEQTFDFKVNDGELKQTNNKTNLLQGLKFISIHPNQEILEEMILLRKFPEKRRLKELQQRLIGAFFTGSNEEEENFDTLFILQTPPVPYLQEIILNNSKAYRYYRFFTADKSPVNIAHMEFLGLHSKYLKCTKPTPLPITSVQSISQRETNSNLLWRINGIPLRTGSKPESAFDGNFETFVGSSTIGMDFGKPVLITHVRFIPRNANNTITVGDTYRLNYHDGKNWKEHSTQMAQYNYLNFKNVPSNTLYWLQNLDKGKEELPFFYKEGQQYFMNIDFAN